MILIAGLYRFGTNDDPALIKKSEGRMQLFQKCDVTE
jgi:hypothetical protein